MISVFTFFFVVNIIAASTWIVVGYSTAGVVHLLGAVIFLALLILEIKEPKKKQEVIDRDNCKSKSEMLELMAYSFGEALSWTCLVCSTNAYSSQDMARDAFGLVCKECYDAGVSKNDKEKGTV